MSQKEDILRLIVQQLYFYDMNSLAKVLADSIGQSTLMDPSNELSDLVYSAKKRKVFCSSCSVFIKESAASNSGLAGLEQKAAHFPIENNEDYGPCLEISADSTKVAPAQKQEYATVYVTTHKISCTTAAFNSDGRYVATGSADNSLKVLDVERLKMSSADEKPVLRTYYDHTAAVNDVAFHPNSRVLASCSEDGTIKLYDLQKVGMKRGFRYFQDAVPIKSLAFHPSGDYIMAGTTDNIIRMYDIQYLRCYSGMPGKDMHEMGINQIRYHHGGKMYVTAGEDGDVKIWDTASSQCVSTISNAHGGLSVSSALITQNGKYVLSVGEEGVPKLWDLSSGSCLVKYEGAFTSTHPTKACLSWNEEYVFSADEKSKSIVTWCARTGTLLSKLSGHAGCINHVQASPSEDVLVSCSEDARARFWTLS